MTNAMDEALASLRTMLAADGYGLVVQAAAAGLVAEIRAGPEACADCLVPKELMRIYIVNALRPVLGDELPPIEISYPGELG